MLHEMCKEGKGCDLIITVNGEEDCARYQGKANLQWGRLPVSGCPSRTHGKALDAGEKQFKLNPLKASKRSRARKI